MHKCSKVFQWHKQLLLRCALFIIITPFTVFALNPISEPNDAELDTESNLYNLLERNRITADISYLTTDLMGDTIDPYSGALSFRVTDVNIPGNSIIPVSLSRTLRNGDSGGVLNNWVLDIPRIEGRYAALNGPDCNKDLPDAFTSGKFWTSWFPWDYHNGLNLHSGNGHSATVLSPYKLSELSFNVPTGYNRITKDNWLLKCTGTNNSNYIAQSPNGLKYTFSVIARTNAPPARKGGSIIITHKVAKLVKRIEDRFNNWVEFDYEKIELESPATNYESHRLTSITAKDGRSINLYYYSGGINKGRLEKVISSGKAWLYRYNSSGNLSEVERPDGKKWKYELDEYSRESLLDVERVRTYTVNATHPMGTRVNYTLRTQFQYKPGQVNLNVPVGSTVEEASRIPVLAVTNKTIIVDGSNAISWDYEYSDHTVGVMLYDYSANQWLERESIDKQINTIKGPNNTIVNVFNRWRDWHEGELLSKSIFDSTGKNLIRQKNFSYKSVGYYGEGPWDDMVDSNFQLNSISRAPKTRTLVENGNTYSTIYDKYNDYGALLQSHSYNSFNNNVRYVKQTYQHDTTNWLLNLPKASYMSKTNVFSTPHKETSYHSATGSYKSSPYESKIMGRVVARNSQYHSDGNLKKVEYVGTGRYELFEDYKRGKARKVTLPCQKTNACNTANGSTSNTVIAKLVVNDDGTIDKMTDYNGNSTNYDYNPMGWLTKIDPVDSKWSNTNISYGVVTTANDGLSGSGAKVGQLKQTVTQGNSQKLTYFDSMLRPYLVRTRDTSNTSTTSYQRSEYDHENRVTFASFPSRSITASAGVRSVFDALGRKKSDTRTTDSASTQYSYLSNNRVSVTDAKNNTTITSYLAYGSPSQSKATYIDSPEGVDTSISYNLFGQIKSITQGSITETRLYDNYQQLCKTVRPDTGVTAFGYNSARQMVWQAEGASGSVSACDSGQVPASQKTQYTYNNWGTIGLENYPDGSPDKVYGYDENGQLETLTAGTSLWSYQYNSLGMVEKQTLAIDNKSFVIDPDYNSLGHLKSLTYPSGRVVGFAPNALGQATKAGSYAQGAKYHANSSLDSFTYGNGLTYKRTLNSEQQPYELTVKQGSSYKSRHRYLYDDNNNVDYIYDFTDRRYDIGLGYDELDRLATASGKWGSGSFSYDNLGNLLTKNLGSQSLNYHYDTTKNRLSSVTGAVSYTFQYDARGHVRNNGRYGLIFNRANQLTNAKGNAYVYDGHNRLVKKVTNGKNVYSVYGIDGTLYYREDSQQKKTDYIRLGTELVAKDDSTVVVDVTPTTPPSTVSSLSGSASSCNIFSVCNFVANWTHNSPNTVTQYELYKFESISEACPPKTICLDAQEVIGTIGGSSTWIKVYSGNASTFTITSSADYVSFKVRACNANGCSAYSPIKRVESISDLI